MINDSKIRLYGHMRRMNGNKMKSVFGSERIGARRVGRLRKRPIDSVGEILWGYGCD